MNTQKLRTVYTLTLVVLDALLVGLAFVLAFLLRRSVPFPAELANPFSLSDLLPLIVIQILCVVFSLFVFRQYYIPRAISRVDQVYSVALGVTMGTLFSIALATLTFKENVVVRDLPRAMLLYAWLLGILFILLGRVVHTQVRVWLRQRGYGTDRVLIVGTGDVARFILQRILRSPYLGYEVVGIVSANGRSKKKRLLRIPILGRSADLPRLIEQHDIDEVIIAIPERGHREAVRVINYCEQGRISIKVFPDIFQFVTSQAGIDDLGGLPLLSVRDYALRGYLLIFKRLMDISGALVGLVLLSPLMLLVAIAIKLESPGPVFFVQERMGLDAKPFMMLKFRSMRSDAERLGPGWTVDNDPRQTKLGILIRKIKVDELPQLINVLLGEMSLVGPRPEQAHYVEQFRESIPQYMNRHHEKGGMTGWAQINGLQGDTSITERTKFDLWYGANWSLWLDMKIILRTLWQILFLRRSADQHPPTTASPELIEMPSADQLVSREDV